MHKDPIVDLRDAMQTGDFDDALGCCERMPWKAVYKSAQEGDPDGLTAVSMSAELLDYIGRFSDCSERLDPVAQAAEKRLRALVEEKNRIPISIEERRTLKRWVWVLMQVAMADYRAMQLDRARTRLDLCETAILQHIRNAPAYLCCGTLSRIQYGIGLIHREAFDYPAAKHRFLRSIEFAWQSLREKFDSKPDERSRQSRWTDLAIARALALGLGYVYHAEGQANLALPVLLSAKNLLSRFDEKRISTYVDLIYFDARRSVYGNDSSVVDESIQGLKRCRQTFVDLNHDLYRARADYSLALAFSQRARQDEAIPLTLRGDEDLKQAEHYAKELGEYGRSNRDCRAELYSTLCRSRIERKRNNLVEAERLATQAVEASAMYPHLRVGALIARAEAEIRQERADAAITDFLEAKDRSGCNLRSRAISLLRVAEIYARTNRSRLALKYFEEWKEIKPHVSNAYMSRLERTAQAAMENSSADFVVRMSDSGLDHDALERRLRGFLVEWAYNQTKREGDEKAAKILGVSRQTLVNWKTAARQPS